MDRPRLSFGLHARAEQRMALLPKMLQSVEVLQLPALELSCFLQKAFEENEALTLDEPVARSEEPAGRPDREASDRHEEWLQSLPAPAGGLVPFLEEQLALLDVTDEERDWVRFLIGVLDEHGLLSAPDEHLLELARARDLEAGEERLGRAIGILQGLEPRGVGGRDSVEAMLLQLDPHEPDYPFLCTLLEEFLEPLSRNKRPAVARALGVEIAQLEGLLEKLAELSPKPAGELFGEAARPVIPDVSVERGDDGSFRVAVEGAGFPSVGIDEGVRELARDKGQTGELRTYLRGKIDQARWIVEAVRQRKETLQMVVTLLFHRQRAFLEHGPEKLAPLRMADLAESLGMHPSTVSRAVAAKWVATPFGVLPLRRFFQAAAPDGAPVAREGVRDRVRALVDAEDPKSPLSDEELVDALAAEGHRMARRTVAKYRKELGIPSSYRRRRFA